MKQFTLGLLLLLAATDTSSAQSIVAWGDSLTAGAKASSPQTTYPADLTALLGRTVTNKGIGGQTSSEIAARQGGAPALLTFVGNTLPPSGGAVVQSATVFPVTSQGPASLPGFVKTVHGLLTLSASHLVFTRDGSGLPVVVLQNTPFVPDTNTRGWINALWLGRNNFLSPSQVVYDTQACVNFLTTTHYVVLSVLNASGEGIGTSNYNAVVSLNASLAQSFSGHYLDVRAALVASYDPSNAQDVLDHQADVVPSSLRGDILHLNDAGYAIVAQQVAGFIVQQGW